MAPYHSHAPVSGSGAPHWSCMLDQALELHTSPAQTCAPGLGPRAPYHLHTPESGSGAPCFHCPAPQTRIRLWDPAPPLPSPTYQDWAPEPHATSTQPHTPELSSTLPCMTDLACRAVACRAPLRPMGSPTRWHSTGGMDLDCKPGIKHSWSNLFVNLNGKKKKYYTTLVMLLNWSDLKSSQLNVVVCSWGRGWDRGMRDPAALLPAPPTLCTKEGGVQWTASEVLQPLSPMERNSTSHDGARR